MSDPLAAPPSEIGAEVPYEHDVLNLCGALLRFDTTNNGDPNRRASDPTVERAAAEWVAGHLTDGGLTPQFVEAAPGRANVLARVPGRRPDRPALLVHGHLDVVPARAHEWRMPPFAGELDDEYLWGRGAVDMKDMLAMMLACVHRWHRTGERPDRDIVFAFLADEEAGSRLGAHWIVDNHADLFEGIGEAVSEVGGFSATLHGDRRVYLIESARKGVAWRRLSARGYAGHGSVPRTDNAVARIANAVARIAAHQWPLELTDTTRHLVRQIAAMIDAPPTVAPEELLGALGPLADMVNAGLRNTAVPTNMAAGEGMVNVIAGHAQALIDGRYVPGQREQFATTLADLAGPGVEISCLNDDDAGEHPFAVPLVSAMTAALRTHDPAAAVAPYCLSGGTDNSAFSRIGIDGYGFVPLRLPSDFDFPAMFHGTDERIPIDALRFGAACLNTFLLTC